MKIVLIDPKGLTFGLNSGLGYVAAVLKTGGHDVSVIDFNNKPGNEENRLNTAKDADYVGISIKSFTLSESIKIANIVKKINQATTIIAGGPHITIDGPNFLKENKNFDLAVITEAEKTLLEIVNKKPSETINNLIYREGEEIKINPKGEWIEDLGSLPFPDYTLFDSSIDAYPLVTSRGCPYQCTYCSIKDVMGYKWRARSPENIINELKQAKNKHNINEFKVLDDNFTLDMNRAKKLCRLLIENNINMKWSCPNGIRADRLDQELIQLMKQSGCYSISLGIESLDPEVFEKIDKGEKLEDVKNAINLIKQACIEVNGFFIIGLPGSTYEKDRFSIKESKKLGLSSSSWGILVPYPGTKIWDWFNSEEVKILGDWKKGFHIGFSPKPVFETKQYSAKQMVKAYYIANLNTMGWRIIPNAFKLFLKTVGL